MYVCACVCGHLGKYVRTQFVWSFWLYGEYFHIFFTIYERQETVKCFVFRKESKILGAHSEVVNSSWVQGALGVKLFSCRKKGEAAGFISGTLSLNQNGFICKLKITKGERVRFIFYFILLILNDNSSSWGPIIPANSSILAFTFKIHYFFIIHH